MINAENAPRQAATAVPGEESVRIRASVDVPVRLADGLWRTAQMITFTGLADGLEHVAVQFGPARELTPVRLHSECLTGDVFSSGRCDCGEQLTESMQLLADAGGLLLYLRQEGRGIGLYNKLDAYRIQDEMGLDTFAANRELSFSDDQRDYRSAAQMLKALGASRIRLHTNNPDKTAQLATHGIDVEEQVPTGIFRTDRNHRYLLAKARYSGHTIELAGESS
ncbi:GTP cyclohydrolase II RibA [Streptomyces sp. NPDC088348]|uniref:GTP cyclohydrolase II RibA n=1 Tax=Streptomyces sp. NPDC088348 TaxID=3365853 RepID=UPI003805EFCE